MSDGYDAMGKPIPAKRMSAAYRTVKQMVPGIGTEDAMTLVGRVAGALEPYEAMRLATGAPLPVAESAPPVAEPASSDMPPVQLDVTGGYRLLAVLLAG
jgi:hypothetical protein